MTDMIDIPRSDEAVVAEVRRIQASGEDFFGFITGDLVTTLPFDLAKEFLLPSANASEWEAHGKSVGDIVARIRDYLPFAWDKANGCRGLSAGRSINHMQAWLWLLGENEASVQIEDYDRYGKPQLRAISEAVGFDWKSADDGAWRNSEDGEGASAADVPPIALTFVGPLANGAARNVVATEGAAS